MCVCVYDHVYLISMVYVYTHVFLLLFGIDYVDVLIGLTQVAMQEMSIVKQEPSSLHNLFCCMCIVHTLMVAHDEH